MAEDKEPTLEELMAELDAGLTLEGAPDSGAAPGAAETDTSEFEAELGLLAQCSEASAELETTAAAPAAPAAAPAAPAAAPAAPTAAPAAPAAAPPAAPRPAAEARQGPSADHGAASSVASWWATVKASAEGLISADGIAIDTAGISTDYQRGKEVSREYASKLSSLFSMASQEVLTTAADVVASARTMNSKILLKPQASFGVPLELIMKREQGFEDAAGVPLVLEGLLSILEQHVKTSGGGALPVALFAATPDEDEFAKLEGFRDALDVGETIEALELSSEPAATIVALVKLFLLELPQPLLTHACYQEFLNALLFEGGATSATDVVDLLPPPHRAAAGRVLEMCYACFVSACADAAAARHAENRLALVLGPLLLRSSNKEKQYAMLHLPLVQEATKVLLRQCAYIFQHSCWFLRPYLGVYALRLTGGDKETENSELWSELIIDAGGMQWENKAAKAGTEVDASGWGRIPMRTADAVRSMVAAAKFDERTLLVCFAGDCAQDGLAEIEEVVIEEAADGQGLQERITRRFAGRWLRPLPWQEEIDKWRVRNVGLEWDEDVHSRDLLELWRLAMPGTEAPARKDARWNQIGFQQVDPQTDFRAAGTLPLTELLHMAKTETQEFCAMLARSKGDNAELSYPFACGGINVIYMLLDLLRLLPGKRIEATSAAALAGSEDTMTLGRPKDRFPNKRGAACRRALGLLLKEDALAFSHLFSAAMHVLDEEWAQSTRSYLQFNDVLHRVKTRVRAALRDRDMSTVADLKRLLSVRP